MGFADEFFGGEVGVVDFIGDAFPAAGEFGGVLGPDVGHPGGVLIMDGSGRVGSGKIEIIGGQG